MKKLTLLSMFAVLAGITATAQAGHRHHRHTSHHRSSVERTVIYLSGYDCYGDPIYTKRVFVGYDCRHYPIYRYYRMPSHYRPYNRYRRSHRCHH